MADVEINLQKRYSRIEVSRKSFSTLLPEITLIQDGKGNIVIYANNTAVYDERGTDERGT